MTFDILTIFPEYFDSLNQSLIKKAIDSKKFSLNITNIRDYSKDKHKKTDDSPYSGGAGMLMTPDPIISCIDDIDPKHEAYRIYMSPRGTQLKQQKVMSLAKKDKLLILCADYEGVDQRVIDLAIDEEISIGDYVLTGGELPAMVLINCVSRYLDGVLGSSESVEDESFSNGLLEYPQYTRPETYKSLKVPQVLLNGNQKDIEKWKIEQSLAITMKNRPDLFNNINISEYLPKKSKKHKS